MTVIRKIARISENKLTHALLRCGFGWGVGLMPTGRSRVQVQVKRPTVKRPVQSLDTRTPSGRVLPW